MEQTEVLRSSFFIKQQHKKIFLLCDFHTGGLSYCAVFVLKILLTMCAFEYTIQL